MAGWRRLGESSILNFFFNISLLVFLLLLVSWYFGLFSTSVQMAFDAVSALKVERVFVDSGAFPAGIYNSRACFSELNENGWHTRIVGLFSSASSGGNGTVSLWVPVVHPTEPPRWSNVVLRNQLYQKGACTNLFSTRELDALRAVPFLTKHAHCIVLNDGWVAPLSPDPSGIYLHVVFSPPLQPPSPSLLPEYLKFRDVFGICQQVAPYLLGPAAAFSVPQSPTHMPKLTSEELTAWRMMGFPFNRQWRWAYDSTLGHGLSRVPAPVHMFTDLHVLPARMRSLPFSRVHAPRTNGTVGALVHIDYHTGLPPSRPHGFLHHCSLLDDASRFGRMYPTTRATGEVALECLAWFQADLQREHGKPIRILAVRGDNVPFGGEPFKDGCARWRTGPIHVELIGFYAHEQAGNIERFHGVRMATARVLLRYAMIPGTWWPYATSHANAIHNMLPSSANRTCPPLQYLRGKKVSWEAEHMGVFGHFAMVWLAPPQRGETSKQLADRARPAIYLGCAARLDNSSSLSSHFFMIDEEEFCRAAHFRLDYSRPPPGWPLKAGDRARSVDVLSELLALPESLDVGSYLIDELPLPNATLPEYLEEEGATPIPKDLLSALPNLDVTPVVPVVSQKVPTLSFDLAPPRLPSDPSPAPPALIDQYDGPDEPDPTPAPRLPVQPRRQPSNASTLPSIYEIVQPRGDAGDAPARAPDPLSRPTYIDSHGTDEEWHPNHCPNANCEFLRGHSGPCSDQLPDKGQSVNPHAPPSQSLRPRNRGNFTRQERSSIASFAFRVLTLAAAATTDHVGQEGDIRVGYLPGHLFLTSYDNSVFIAQPGQETAASIPIPKGIRQALASERRDFWLEAIYKEYGSILSHNVFSVVRRCDVAAGTDIMRCHCIFTAKPNEDGSIERYKCRLVVDGNSQTFGVNFTEIFSTVVKFGTFRMALHLAAVRDYNITAIDISTAFLYGDIDNPNCYMEMPEGLPRYDAEGYELVCHLLKSIYGLRQAPRIWFNHFKASLLSFGFVQSQVDPCLFIYKHESSVIYGLLWVDDLVLMTNDDRARNRLVEYLRGERKYTLSDKGEATWLLGIALSRNREKRTLPFLSLFIYRTCSLASLST